MRAADSALPLSREHRHAGLLQHLQLFLVGAAPQADKQVHANLFVLLGIRRALQPDGDGKVIRVGRGAILPLAVVSWSAFPRQIGVGGLRTGGRNQHQERECLHFMRRGR